MAASFKRTFAALRGDLSRTPLVALGLAALILSAWLAWGLGSEVAIYRSSGGARIEVSPAPTRLSTPVAGRVSAVHLEVGREVKAGDVLLELDATPEQIATAKAQSKVAALTPQVESVQRELEAEEAAVLHDSAAELEAEQAVRARLRATDAELELAQNELERERTLAATDASPKSTLQNVRSNFKRRRAEFEAIRHESKALEATHRSQSDSRRARLEQLKRQHGQLAEDLAAAQSELRRLEYELARRTLRAPVDGVLGEVISLRPGATVDEGVVVATVVPAGQLRVVAEYAAAAVGRVAPGQAARVRLDGFPSTRYGTVAARVSRVATELRDGTIRVELELVGTPPDWVRHGMTGAVDAEIERLSPIALLLRVIGEGLDGRSGS